MKRYSLGLAFLIGLVGCTQADRAEVRDETRARTEDASQRAAEQRREWQADIDRRLDKIDAQMEEEKLKAETRRLNAKAKAEYQEKMAELRQERAEIAQKYNNAKNATDSGWENFKDEVGQAVDKMESGWNRFVADLKD
jgi:thiamine biosynthesis lipoprotein ApbE